MSRGEMLPLEAYFKGRDPLSRELFEGVRRRVESLGDVEMRVTKSQIAWRRRIAFAWVWMPRQYLRGKELAPLVLTVGLGRTDRSERWKEVIEPRPGRFAHHLELRSAEEIDDEVLDWLREAWEAAQ